MARPIKRVKQRHGFKQEVYSIRVAGVNVMVTVTSTASVVKRWLFSRLYFHRRRCNVNMKPLVVSLGVRPTPVGSEPLPADTLQLCIGRRCLIFNLSRAERVPRKLRTFLNDPSHKFVGWNNKWDLNQLKSSKHRLKMCHKPLDLKLDLGRKHYAETEDYKNRSCASVLDEIVKAHNTLNQGGKNSNWNKEYLSHLQVANATVVAYGACRIGRNIRIWNSTCK